MGYHKSQWVSYWFDSCWWIERSQQSYGINDSTTAVVQIWLEKRFGARRRVQSATLPSTSTLIHRTQFNTFSMWYFLSCLVNGHTWGEPPSANLTWKAIWCNAVCSLQVCYQLIPAAESIHPCIQYNVTLSFSLLVHFGCFWYFCSQLILRWTNIHRMQFNTFSMWHFLSCLVVGYKPSHTWGEPLSNIPLPKMALAILRVCGLSTKQGNKQTKPTNKPTNKQIK